MSVQLLSKITVGGQELKNRVVMAAMTRARCDVTDSPLNLASTIPNDVMVEYYRQRASAGLLLTEGTAISEEGSGWPFAPHIRSTEHVTGWKKVTDAVHEAGGIIYLQLWHIGRQTHPSFHPTTNRIVAPSAIPMAPSPSNDKADIHGVKRPNVIPHELTIEEIQATVQDYVKAAALAKEAGFDGVEIHGSNGYLPDIFLQSKTNHRTDQYGGSIENRCRFVLEIIEAIIAQSGYPSNRVGIKLGPNGNYGDMGSADNDQLFPTLARLLKPYNLAFIEVTDGLGFGYHGLCPPVTVYEMKKEFGGLVIANVCLTKDIAEGMIRSGAADMCSFGRPYISNPDLVERFANDWPLAPPAEYPTWWGHLGASGYTDWPTYAAVAEEK